MRYPYLEALKLSILLVNYLPYLFFLEMGLRAWVMIVGGVYLVITMGLRNLVLTDRLTSRAKITWTMFDTVVWAGVQQANGWDGNYAYLVLAFDAAMAGRRLHYGFPYVLAVGIVTLGAKALNWYGLHYYVSVELFPVAVGLALVYAFMYMTVKLEKANAELQAYTRQAEEIATLRERNRLAHEVHDTVTHGFTGMIMQLEAVKVLLESDPAAAAERLDRMQQGARTSLDELRRSVHALRPHSLDGIAALSRLMEELSGTGLAAQFKAEGEPVALPPSYDLCLYRAVQEALTNALRHGQAKRASVSLVFGRDIVLTVADNGRGPDGLKPMGMGLLGIRERAEALGGVLETAGAPGEGFTLTVTLPTPGPRVP